METPRPPTSYETSVERPGMLIVTGLNVILAVALVIAAILKVYMLVLTDLTCAAEGTSLGNLIRCTAMLDLAAGFLAASATLTVARTLLSPRPEIWSRALGLAATAAFLSLLKAFVDGGHDGHLTLATSVLFLVILASMYGGGAISAVVARMAKDDDT